MNHCFKTEKAKTDADSCSVYMAFSRCLNVIQNVFLQNA